MAKYEDDEVIEYISDAVADIGNALEMLEDCDCDHELEDLRYIAKRLLDKRRNLWLPRWYQRRATFRHCANAITRAFWPAP